MSVRKPPADGGGLSRTVADDVVVSEAIVGETVAEGWLNCGGRCG